MIKNMNSDQSKNVTIEIRDNIAVIWLDKSGSEQNVMSFDLLSDFEDTFLSLANDDSIEGMVLISKKKDFIAGFDIHSFKAEKKGDFIPIFEEGHRFLQYLEDFPKPIVSAVHGVCYGLGLEITLACQGRIASDDSRTKFGLPEVKLGILPAGGGTQRLPRLIGASAALDMMLTGKNIFAKKALRMGLVDEVVNQSKLLIAACSMVKKLKDNPLKRKRKQTLMNRFLDHTSLGNRLVFSQARKTVQKMTKGHYPAPLAIIDCVETGLKKGIKAGYQRESELCEELIIGDVSKELMNIFFTSTEKKKNPIDSSFSRIESMGIMGAGFMGAGIAEISIKNGLDVLITDVADKSISHARTEIWKRLSKKVKRKAMTPLEAKEVIHRMRGNVTLSEFSKVDLVIEAVFENMNLKKEIIADLEDQINRNTIIASNTSSLSISEMAESAKRPENIIGMHYFSPVPLMPLLEIIRTPFTSEHVVAASYDLGVRQGKTCIIVKDSPGFYVNRILGPYMNEALKMFDEGVDAKSIDNAIVKIGFPMGPLALMDHVGLDVCADVISEDRILAMDEKTRLEVSFTAKKMHDEGGLLGKKGGKGFYLYDHKTGKKSSVNSSVDTLIERGSQNKIPLIDIQNRLLYSLLNEAALTLSEGIISNPKDGDIGAIFGMGFPPFEGGPFRMLDKNLELILSQMEKLVDQYGERFKPVDFLKEHQKTTKYFYKN